MFTGTITLLIIKHDEQTGNYRDKTGVLKEYAHLNKLPRVRFRHQCWSVLSVLSGTLDLTIDPSDELKWLAGVRVTDQLTEQLTV